MTDHAMESAATIAVHFVNGGSVHKCTITVQGVDASQPTALLGSVADILAAFDQTGANIPGTTILGVSGRSAEARSYTVILSADGRPLMDACQSEDKAQAALEAAWRRAMAVADPMTQRDAFREALDGISVLHVAEDKVVGRQITEAFESVTKTFEAVSENLAALAGAVATLGAGKTADIQAGALASRGEPA